MSLLWVVRQLTTQTATLQCTDTQTSNRLTASFPGQPGQAGTRKVTPIWILMKQEMTEWQWHQLDHMQIICTSLQTDNHASTSSLNFLQADALSDAQPKCQSTEGSNITMYSAAQKTGPHHTKSKAGKFSGSRDANVTS